MCLASFRGFEIRTNYQHRSQDDHFMNANPTTMNRTRKTQPFRDETNFGEHRDLFVALPGERTQTFDNKKRHDMEIRVHTCRGSVETFVQDDPALVARILK